jgi:RHS repeat-associated protein
MRVGTPGQTGTLTYLHGDHLGSTSLATDDEGEELYRRGYYPFGEERYAVGVAVTDYGFTGQREEAHIDLIEMGARWYDPYLNRFVSPDSIVPNPANPQSYNRYSYVYNNPLVYVDPSGHAPLVPYDVCQQYPQACGGQPPGPPDYAGLGLGPDPLSPELQQLAAEYAALYGLPESLVAGIVAVEIKHDTAWHDPYVDDFLLSMISWTEIPGAPMKGVPRWFLYYWEYYNPISGNGPGPGLANFHTGTAREVEEYFRLYYGDSPELQLPFSGQEDYERFEYLASDEGSVHYTAAYLRMLADYRKGTGGLPSTTPHLYDLTVDDMTVIAGAFRADMVGMCEDIPAYQTIERAEKLGLLIVPYLQ